MTSNPEFDRTISSNNQIYLPPPYRISEFWYIPEPGALKDHDPDEIHLFPEDDPPVVMGEFAGEQRRAPMGEQGQLTIPRDFLKLTPMEPGDEVTLTGNDAGYLILKQKSE